jgi:hypothetical protein
VGYLLYALLELDQVLKAPKAVLTQKAIILENGRWKTTMNLDNW